MHPSTVEIMNKEHSQWLPQNHHKYMSCSQVYVYVPLLIARETVVISDVSCGNSWQMGMFNGNHSTFIPSHLLKYNVFYADKF